MTLRNKKLLIGVFILFAYMSMGIFGSFHMNHMTSTPMLDCPYAQNSFSICKNGLDHINDWHRFSNTVLPSLFIFSFLIFGMILFFFIKRNFLNQERFFYKLEYYLDNKELYFSREKIIKWLSLFENSPSLS